MTPLDRHGRLAVSGKSLIDQSGTPVLLRGLSLFWSQWAGEFYSREWVRTLARDWNVDVVRAALGVSPDGYLSFPEREAARVEEVVDAAIGAGIYVIVDWHSHVPETAAALDFFGRIERRYRGVPNLLYESWNEPKPEETWRGTIRAHHAAVLSLLRGLGADNVVICGTPGNCREVDVAARDPISFANVCYALHFYAGSHRAGLRERAEKALDLGACLFASEYGLAEADGDGTVDLAEMNRWWDFLEERGISHVNWSLCDKAENCAALRPGVKRPRRWPLRGLTQSGRAVRQYLRAARR